MNLAIRFLSVINTIQLGAFRWGAMFLVITVAAIVTAGVFFRYVLNDSLSWSEELAKYAMLWLVFLGAPIALRLGVHPNIEIIISRFPSKATRAILAVMHLAVFIFCAFLAMKSHDFAWNGRRQVAISVGDVSMYWFFVSIPLGMASMALVALQQFLEDASGLFSAKPTEEDGFVTKYRPVMDEF
ncbi:MAG: TRAP transporter small permease [Alphaproteobacteria bacterium]|jgi:TRAP-type C4-dicarboxylate transport system permease small subunit|nr:TRAP transporter small permease [Alphaproteobacteria bacterium]